MNEMAQGLFATQPSWVPDWGSDTWSFLQTVFIALGALLAVSQLWLLRRQLTSQHTADLRNRALELDRDLAHLQGVRKSVDEAFPPEKHRHEANPSQQLPVPLEEIEGLLGKDAVLKMNLKHWLGHWETLALTVLAGSADEDMVYELLGGIVLRYTERFRHFIESQQKADGPKAYCYLVALAHRWHRRREREGDKAYFLKG